MDGRGRGLIRRYRSVLRPLRRRRRAQLARGSGRQLAARKLARAELASAIFEWIEGWYNPRRRHTSIDDPGPVDYERLYAAAKKAA